MASNKTSPHKDAGARLRRLRDLQGLTQREFALEMKVAHGAIAAWESGKQDPPGPVIKLLEIYEEELGVEPAGSSIERLDTSVMMRTLALTGAAANGFARAAAAALGRMLAPRNERNEITRRAHAAIARNLITTLGGLKGAAMKVGQTLGFLDFTLPEATRGEVAALQFESRPMSPMQVAQVFLEEFGDTPRALFADWTPTPFAAASIGQVHHARLHSGEAVAVKVQYPRIIEAIDADLRGARVLDELGALLFRGQERGTFLAEVRERFTEECDYRIEAANLAALAPRWSGTPGIGFPRVFEAFTRRRVLVTSFERGEHVDAFAARADAATRNRVGALLWRFAWQGLLRHGEFHADPHAGNFLFSADGVVVVLDFGCVKRMSAHTVTSWRALMRALLERRADDVRALLQAMNFGPAAGYDFAAHHHLLLEFYEPWLRERFEFTPAFAEKAWRVMMIDNPNKFRANMPRDLFFANRLLFGLYALLGRLGAAGDFRDIGLDVVYERGDARPAPFTSAEISALLMT